jgi:hypothetical protein
MDALKILKSPVRMLDSTRISVVEHMLTLPGSKVEGFGIEELRDDRLIDDAKIKNIDATPIEIALKLITIGSVAIFGLNFELMSEIGLRMKEKAPFKDTILISLYEGGSGGSYFVDKWGYEKHTPSYYRNKVKDACTEERVTEEMLDMFDTALGK